MPTALNTIKEGMEANHLRHPFSPLDQPWLSPHVRSQFSQDQGASNEIWRFHSPLLQQWKRWSLNHVWLFATPWTTAYQVPLFMGFSRQERWCGLSCHSLGDFSNLRIEPRPPALAGRLFIIWATREAGAPIKPCLNFLFGLWSISID